MSEILGDFDLLIIQPFEPLIETTLENYLKAAALLSYPSNYVKAFALLERPVDLYMRFSAPLQAEAGRYIKTQPLLQQEVFPYIKFELAFPGPAERYLKTVTTMQAGGDMYIRTFAQFAITADYIKVRAALTKQPVIGDVGESGPANKVGLLSRHYLSVTSVKKEV